MDYCSATKGNKPAIRATSWLSLKTCGAKETRHKRGHTVGFHLSNIPETAKWQTKNGLPGYWPQRGSVGNFLRWWKNSIALLWWWLHNSICLSQLRTVFLKRMNFTACKLDLKPDLKIIIRLGVRGVDVTGATLMTGEARWWVDGDLLDLVFIW